MNEIKPTWKIAQQISRKHTLISLTLTLPLFLGSILLSLTTLKILGYSHVGLMLANFYLAHKKLILAIAAFTHFVPVNFYAIMRVLSADYKDFTIKTFSVTCK
jgi:hypothetical protein